MNGDELQRTFGRMEGKLDAIQASVNTLSERLDAHSKRLGALERSRAWLIGLGAALAALWSTATVLVFLMRG